MTIKYAFSRPTADDQETSQLFDGYERAGYDGLQLKWGQYEPYLQDPQAFLGRYQGKKGVASALIAGGALPHGDSKEQLRRLYAFAAKIGVERIVYCHGVRREGLSDQEIAGFAPAFEEMGKEAQQHGLRLSVHHHHGQPIMHRRDFDLFFGAVKDPSLVGLTVDTAHLVKSGIDEVAEIITSFAPFIDNFHMKDFADGDFQILGRGAIDFGPIFAAIRQIGYTGWMSADEESGGGVEEGLHECIDFMKAGMANRVKQGGG
ncbi:sugar phosphate isomerase/epimerase family protein [Paenibacillus sp. 1P07SE]|uniref:sugar phosphate isomerase/epimerase family protein n=1 Tax=Paenibacillus sp. 1P07SE TaxID=3132209 RepID=UPI0039A52D96